MAHLYTGVEVEVEDAQQRNDIDHAEDVARCRTPV